MKTEKSGEKQRKKRRKEILLIITFSLVYVMLGNARSVEQNPFIPGAVIAFNMVVPVLGGILFGKRQGLLIGILGTALNALTPAGTIFEWLAIIPHGIMGYVAGALKERYPSPLPSLSIALGHALNIVVFAAFGYITTATMTNILFWYGIAYETFVGVLAIIITKTIFNLGFGEEE